MCVISPNREIKYCPTGKVANAFDYERKKLIICKKPLSVYEDPDPEKEEKDATKCGPGEYSKGFDINGNQICRSFSQIVAISRSKINVNNKHRRQNLGQHIFVPLRVGLDLDPTMRTAMFINKVTTGS